MNNQDPNIDSRLRGDFTVAIRLLSHAHQYVNYCVQRDVNGAEKLLDEMQTLLGRYKQKFGTPAISKTLNGGQHGSAN